MLVECTLLEFLAEHRPDSTLEEFFEVGMVLEGIARMPRLRGESEDETSPRTLKQLHDRAERIVAALIKVGLLERRSDDEAAR